MSIKANYPDVRPTLNLDFANTKRLDPRISFTRASTGTYVDADGLIKTAAVNAGRFDHDPATGESKGLLIEESRTNLVTYSNDSSNWSVEGSDSFTFTSSASVGSDGLLSLTKVEVTDTTNEVHELWSSTGSSNPSLGLTVSADFKYGTQQYVMLRHYISSYDWVAVTFDIQNGTVTQESVGSGTTSVTGSGVIDFGDDIYRCWVSYTDSVNTTATGNPTIDSVSSATPSLLSANGTEAYAGSGGEYFYAGSIQLEEGSFPTSYIPTSGSTVTRSADVASIATSAFGYNEDEGTLFTEAQTFVYNNSHRVLSISDGTTSNRIIMQAHTTNHLFVGVGGVTQGFCDAGQYYSNQYSKHSVTYQEDNFAACLDGGALATDSSGTIPTVNIMNIGAGATGDFSFLNGHIKKLQYYPVRLSNTVLQGMTT